MNWIIFGTFFALAIVVVNTFPQQMILPQQYDLQKQQFPLQNDMFRNTIQSVGMNCAAQNSVGQDIIDRILLADFNIMENDNTKCFTKCILEQGGLFSGNSLVDQQVLALSAMGNRDPYRAQQQLSLCKPMYTSLNDCNTAWEIFRCLQ